MRGLPFAHENLAPAGDPNRGPLFVGRELDAIGNNAVRVAGRTVRLPNLLRRRPKAIALTEAIGHRLESLDRYGDPVRSIATPGRANLALYLRNGLTGPPPAWVQHQETWPRTKHDGPHPARATLIKCINGGPAVIVGHGPPSVPGAGDARDEWVEVTVGILRRFPHAIWLGDPNGLLPEVRRRLGDPRVGVGGDATDAVLVRGYTIEAADTFGAVNGVPMLTDHKKCLLGRAVVRS